MRLVAAAKGVDGAESELLCAECALAAAGPPVSPIAAVAHGLWLSSSLALEPQRERVRARGRRSRCRAPRARPSHFARPSTPPAAALHSAEPARLSEAAAATPSAQTRPLCSRRTQQADAAPRRWSGRRMRTRTQQLVALAVAAAPRERPIPPSSPWLYTLGRSRPSVQLVARNSPWPSTQAADSRTPLGAPDHAGSRPDQDIDRGSAVRVRSATV